MNRELKINGLVFESIKYRRSVGDQYFKSESLTRVGDMFHECKDGWFLNARTDNRTNILNIDGWEEFFREVKKGKNVNQRELLFIGVHKMTKGIVDHGEVMRLMYNDTVGGINRGLIDVWDILQFTGMKDKNDENIFEGYKLDVDFTTTSWGRGIVIKMIGFVAFGDFESDEINGCSNNIMGWYIQDEKDEEKKISLLDVHDQCEIIGNKYVEQD